MIEGFEGPRVQGFKDGAAPAEIKTFKEGPVMDKLYHFRTTQQIAHD